MTDNHSKVSEKVTERRKVIVERVVAKALEKGTYKKTTDRFREGNWSVDVLSKKGNGGLFPLNG